MNEIIRLWGQWMLATSWQLVVIVIVVGALCFLWRKAPVRMLHLLWLLVFIKLLIPPHLGHDYSLANLLVRSEIFSSQQVAVNSAQEEWQVFAAHLPRTAIEGPIAIEDESVISDNEVGSSLPSTSAQELPVVSGITSFTYQHILFVLWLMGAAGLLLRSLMSAGRFRGWLSAYGQPPPSWFKEKLAEWSQKVGLRKSPGCIIVPESHCPCLFGWFKPQLLFPEHLLKRLTPEQLQMAVCHELTHIKRRDTIMNGLQSLLQILYWFHPLVWLAGREVRHYREMVVDEAVVSAHENLPKHTYEQTILALAEHSPARPVPAMVGILEHRSFVFRRVMRLVASSSKRIGWQRTLLSWVMLALFTFFLIPMGISQPQVSPSGTLNVEKKAFPEVLNEPQRLYMQWTEENFSAFLDKSEYADLSDSAKAELEERWIKVLEGPWSRKYYDTINFLAAIKSKKAVKLLLHIAAERREKDNRDRWMAVRALGIIGDESVVPELIHLIYHYNQNTRFWAQISLARLTGVNFGYDWQKWGEWWNQQGKQPTFSPEKITWTTSYPEWADPQKQKESDRNFVERFSGTKEEESASVNTTPPQIIKTIPAIGAKGVNPSLKEIVVVFDRDMSSGFSWTGGGEVYPKTTGMPLWRDSRTCVLPVELEPGKFYRVGINSKSHKNFRSKEGVPTSPTAIYFTTAGAPTSAVAALTPPKIVSMSPPSGVKNVSPAITELRVTFDQEMGGGCSWTGGGEQFPKVAGEIYWTGDKKTCVLPVKLQPSWSYRLGLNSVSHKNFQSAKGVPLEPVAYTFETGMEGVAPTKAAPLQGEIDKAQSGGVVIVPPGKHEGPLEITKPLTLRGEDARTCTIELLGNEPTITIRGTKDVVLENLTVRWSQKSTDARLEAPAAIYVRDSDAVIRGCRLEPIERPQTTPYAIMAAGRTNVTFTEGRSTGFAYALIFLEGANGTVSNSILTDAGHSVVTMHANSHVKIIGNILGRCEYHAVRNTGGTMDMIDNLVIGDNRAGAYLGNKSAHGRIANNLFSQNRGAIWAYARSDVIIENNVFLAENGPGIGFHDSCNLIIRNNSFVNNAQGLTRYSKEGRPPGIGARTNGNHFWNNKEDFVDFDKETSALYGDPKFTNPSNGDFSPQKGSPLLHDAGHPLAGLTDPEPIRALWATWAALNQ